MADDSAQAAAARLQRVAAVFSTASGLMPIAHAVGKGGREEAQHVARQVAGSDQRLSHLGRRGVRLGMSYDPSDGGARVTMALKPPGPWVLVERGAVAHAIRPKRKQAIHGGGYEHPAARRRPGQRPTIPHPGAKGKGAITRTFGRIRARTGRDAHEEVLRQLRGIYG